MDWKLLPYPQQVKLLGGGLLLGPPDCKSDGAPSETEQIAVQSLGRYLPRKGKAVTIRLGSVEEGYSQRWLTDEQRSFLAKPETSPEASVLTITPEGITVVGKGKWGMLYGVQTVNQLAIQAARENRDSIPCLTIRDWPDAKWRCLCSAVGLVCRMGDPLRRIRQRQLELAMSGSGWSIGRCCTSATPGPSACTASGLSRCRVTRRIPSTSIPSTTT